MRPSHTPRPLSRSRASAAVCGVVAAAGCTGPQSMMDPAGPGAAGISTLWWVLLAVLTAVFVVVMAALGVAVFRRRAGHGDANGSLGRGTHSTERRRVLWVLTAGAFVPLGILAGIFVYAMIVLDQVGPSEPDGALTVVVTGKQFWWDVRYLLPGGDTVRTANEIHVPVGQRVALLLESDNVIHSLWVPRLHGKTDLIPGRTTEMWIEADQPGIYRGQCAEYCGEQHTWMALLVVAEPAEAFQGWLDAQRAPALAASAAGAAAPAGPTASQLARGREVYLDEEHRCTSCHVVRGVNERVRSPGERPVDGPDLTHVASRRMLAGGLLVTNRGNLAGWLANPQVLKPGNLMPRIPLEPEELNALTAYLMSLE